MRISYVSYGDRQQMALDVQARRKEVGDALSRLGDNHLVC